MKRKSTESLTVTEKKQKRETRDRTRALKKQEKYLEKIQTRFNKELRPLQSHEVLLSRSRTYRDAYGLPTSIVAEQAHTSLRKVRLKFARDVLLGPVVRKIRTSMADNITSNSTRGIMTITNCPRVMYSTPVDVTEIHVKGERLAAAVLKSIRRHPLAREVALAVTVNSHKFPRTAYIKIVGAGTIVPSPTGQWHWHLEPADIRRKTVCAIMDTVHKFTSRGVLGIIGGYVGSCGRDMGDEILCRHASMYK
jgi:hypothetical protein